MNYKILNLTEILKEIEKVKSGIILGNGFCNWLYQGNEGKLYKPYKEWNIKDIISETSSWFSIMYSKNINSIIFQNGEIDCDVDRIYHKLKIESKSLADKWLILFLNELLKRVNHKRIKKSENLEKLKIILEKTEYMFTTNYDPSFYWTIMKIKNLWPTRTVKETKQSPRGGRNPNFDDGFYKHEGKLKFTGQDGCKAFYLHGAIFFKKEILEGIEIEKIYSKNTNKDIIKKCDEYLESCLYQADNSLPLLAVIGKSKNDDIQKNNYLKFALNKLINCDKIITFSLSFSEDSHILDNIIKQCEKDYSTNRTLYIGCHNLEADNVTNPLVNFKSYFNDNPQPNNLNIVFYDSKGIDKLDI